MKKLLLGLTCLFALAFGTLTHGQVPGIFQTLLLGGCTTTPIILSSGTSWTNTTGCSNFTAAVIGGGGGGGGANLTLGGGAGGGGAGIARGSHHDSQRDRRVVLQLYLDHSLLCISQQGTGQLG
jgi:hypothetical protein